MQKKSLNRFVAKWWLDWGTHKQNIKGIICGEKKSIIQQEKKTKSPGWQSILSINHKQEKYTNRPCFLVTGVL